MDEAPAVAILAAIVDERRRSAVASASLDRCVRRSNSFSRGKRQMAEASDFGGFSFSDAGFLAWRRQQPNVHSARSSIPA
ncbi:hypothetical protein [Sphingopyxis lindanitolerans]|uniref:hypothetical protein n=1 Tax=Sphingopyxis lindanitolerans TaxID=2054227 RepID=UPI0011B2913E|nr:hypothetical protein [Sphingopyxis lindanitolerans]